MSTPTEFPERIIRPRKGIASVNFPELWRYRDLFWFLAWRDVLVKYKQTYLGVSWAVIQPVLTALIFTFIAGAAKFPMHGAPALIFTFAALLPWQLFSNAVGDSSNSLVASSHMVSRVYFPRLLIPSSAVLSGLIEFCISMIILFGMMVWFQVPFTATLLLLPLFFLFALITAFAAGIWLSALNVKYRDVKYLVPFFTRMGLYVSPVWYLPEAVVPEKWQFLYSLNPLVGVISGFRWCILGSSFEPHWASFSISLAAMLLTLAGGMLYFRSTEKTFADLI